MGNEWRTTTLGEFSPFTYGKSLPARDRSENGEILVYGSGGKSGKHNKAHVNEAGIIVGRKGTVGSVLFSENPFWPIDTTFYITRKEGQDLKFTYYLLKTLRLNEMNADSAVPGLNRDEAHSISFELPPYSEQKKIADVLGSIDNKIQLNRETNKTLEAMAQALFKSWFVDFDPVFDNAIAHNLAHNNAPLHNIPEPLLPHAQRRLNVHNVGRGSARQTAAHAFHHLFPQAFEQSDEPSVGIQGWVPKGWGGCALGEKVMVKRGGSPRPIKDFIVSEGLPWTKISDATASGTRFIKSTKEHIKLEGLSKTTLLKKGTLILSNSATPGLPKFLDLDACIHDGWLHFPEKENFNDHYLYQLFLVVRKELVQQGNGSVFTNLKTDILKNHKMVVPPKSLLDEFGDVVSSIHSKLHALSESTVILSGIRDTLLPKLISGELRIPDAEQASEALAK